MRLTLVMIALILISGFAAFQLFHRAPQAGTANEAAATSTGGRAAKKPDFDSEIKPILQARCQPCHFQGGKVYDKLPFDKPETITRLGTKLFTRIKDEKERAVIRQFLAQSNN